MCKLQRKYSEATKENYVINMNMGHLYDGNTIIFVVFPFQNSSYKIITALISIMMLSYYNITTGKFQLGFPLLVLLRSRKSYNLWKGYTLRYHWQHIYSMIYVNIHSISLLEALYFILCTGKMLITCQRRLTNKYKHDWKEGKVESLSWQSQCNIQGRNPPKQFL